MTLTSQTFKVTYNCNGSQTVFPYTFRILADADIDVVLYTIADGTETTLTLTSEYTVSDAGEQAGGNVTTVATYSSLYKLILRRNLDITQETDYIENDPFPAETHETALDKLTMLVQQNKELADRALLQNSTATTNITFPEASADAVIGWNAGATALENKVGLTTAVAAAAASAAAALVSETNAETAETNAQTAETNAETAETNAETAQAAAEAAQAAAEAAVADVVSSAVIYVIDGDGAVISTGINGDIQIPFAGTITSVTLLADQTGSIVLDLWKDTYANYPPLVGDSITASAKPTISSAIKSTDATLTGWTKSIVAGDILRINVDSVTSIQRCVVVINYTRTIA